MKTKKMFLMFVISIVILFPTLLVYAASYQDFIPFLIDLPGWKAEKPDGADIDMAGVIAISAARCRTTSHPRTAALTLFGSRMSPETISNSFLTLTSV